MASKLNQLRSKAVEASQFVSKHGCAYYKQVMEQNKKYVVEPPTAEKCNELSKQLFYTRLASYVPHTSSGEGIQLDFRLLSLFKFRVKVILSTDIVTIGMLNVKCHEKFKNCIKKVRKSGKVGFSLDCPIRDGHADNDTKNGHGDTVRPDGEPIL